MIRFGRRVSGLVPLGVAGALAIGGGGDGAVAAVESTGLFDQPTAMVIFQGKKNGDGRPLPPQVFSAWTGHFTSPRTEEAVVLVDTGTSHAGGYVEAWLLRRDCSGWRAIELLGRSDQVEVEFYDLDGRGVEAVLVRQQHSGQGIESEDGSLLTWKDGEEISLYEYGEWVDQGDPHHEISFEDLDRDGVAELIDEFLWEPSVRVARLQRDGYVVDSLLTQRYEDDQLMEADPETDSWSDP